MNPQDHWMTRMRVLFFDMLRELVKQSKIVVLVTHNMALANMCDRILVLDKGKLVSLGETR